MADIVHGRHAVLAALTAGQATHVYAAPETRAGREAIEAARQAGAPVSETTRRDLDLWTEEAVHQGVVASVRPFAYATLDDLFTRASASGEPPLILVLDGLQDGRNVGALLRTADAVGVHGVIMPERRAVGVTSSVVRASAGAAYFLPVVSITNMAQILGRLKEREVWVAGLVAGGDTRYDTADLTVPLALLIGAEGQGLGPLVRKHCDLLLHLPMRGHIASLNASVAGSVALYEARKQRGWRQEATEPRS